MDTTALVGTSVVVLATTTFISNVRKGQVEFHTFVSAAFVGVFLGFIALLSDQVARAFAMLIIAVALVRNGNAVFGTLGGKTK